MRRWGFSYKDAFGMLAQSEGISEYADVKNKYEIVCSYREPVLSYPLPAWFQNGKAAGAARYGEP